LANTRKNRQADCPILTEDSFTDGTVEGDLYAFESGLPLYGGVYRLGWKWTDRVIIHPCPVVGDFSALCHLIAKWKGVRQGMMSQEVVD
jgi:hypothetical protein